MPNATADCKGHSTSGIGRRQCGASTRGEAAFVRPEVGGFRPARVTHRTWNPDKIQK